MKKDCKYDNITIKNIQTETQKATKRKMNKATVTCETL